MLPNKPSASCIYNKINEVVEVWSSATENDKRDRSLFSPQLLQELLNSKTLFVWAIIQIDSA